MSTLGSQDIGLLNFAGVKSTVLVQDIIKQNLTPWYSVVKYVGQTYICQVKYICLKHRPAHVACCMSNTVRLTNRDSFCRILNYIVFSSQTKILKRIYKILSNCLHAFSIFFICRCDICVFEAHAQFTCQYSSILYLYGSRRHSKNHICEDE